MGIISIITIHKLSSRGCLCLGEEGLAEPSSITGRMKVNCKIYPELAYSMWPDRSARYVVLLYVSVLQLAQHHPPPSSCLSLGLKWRKSMSLCSLGHHCRQNKEESMVIQEARKVRRSSSFIKTQSHRNPLTSGAQVLTPFEGSIPTDVVPCASATS